MKLTEIAQLVEGRLMNLLVSQTPAVEITGLASLATAQSHELSFLANRKYFHQLAQTQAAAVLISDKMVAHCSVPAIIVADPYLAYAKISHYFDHAPQPVRDIHVSAVIAEDVQLGMDVSIGAHVVIESGCILADRVVIGANSVIGAGCRIGQDSHLYPNVTLYHQVKLGERVIIHSGSVVGSDGFGFAKSKQGWQKIAQLGHVIIGNDVEIGACTSIDRGALENTEIADHVIIDNQVQIAHNVKIGRATAIAGCVGIAGSTHIGRDCTLAGAAGLAGHLRITDGVHLSMQAQVTQSIHESGSYASGTGLLPTTLWRKSVARWRHFDEWVRRVRVVTRPSE